MSSSSKNKMQTDTTRLVDREPDEKRPRIDRHEVRTPTRGFGVVPWNLRRWLKWLAALAAVSCLIFTAGFIFRTPLLAGIAEAWVVNEPVPKADAIVILGGGLENRPFAAARLYRNGVAPVVLYMCVHSTPAQDLGLAASEAETTHQILLKKGVPDSNQFALGTNVSSTFDETQVVRAWLKETGAKSIIIATDSFHTRRARWIFKKKLADTKVEIYFLAVEPIRYQIGGWWRKEEGLIALQNEFVKYVYYRFKY